MIQRYNTDDKDCVHTSVPDQALPVLSVARDTLETIMLHRYNTDDKDCVHTCVPDCQALPIHSAARDTERFILVLCKQIPLPLIISSTYFKGDIKRKPQGTDIPNTTLVPLG